MGIVLAMGIILDAIARLGVPVAGRVDRTRGRGAALAGQLAAPQRGHTHLSRSGTISLLRRFEIQCNLLCRLCVDKRDEKRFNCASTLHSSGSGIRGTRFDTDHQSDVNVYVVR
jgi:hypothetical protein